MEIQINSSVLIHGDSWSRVVQAGTRATIVGNEARFYDTTKVVAVSYPLDVCSNNPMFTTRKSLEDREISLREVKLILGKHLSEDQLKVTLEAINNL